jgi:predicted transcriptional regulator
MDIIMSIHHKHAVKIFNGEKRYEYRRVVPKNINGSKIYLYATIPVGQIVGYLIPGEVISEKKNLVWSQTHKQSGLGGLEFYDYFKGKQRANAIEVKEAFRYLINVNPYDICDFKPPQSFMYLRTNSELLKHLKKVDEVDSLIKRGRR